MTDSVGVVSVSDVGSSSDGSVGFNSAAESVIRSAQASVVGVIESAGLGSARASEIARALDLDKTLAWKLLKFGTADDARAAFRHLPGMAGIEIVVRAAEAVGVAPDRVASLQTSDRALRRFVERHAGDRKTFEAMLAGERPDAKGEEEARRAYFQAGSAIWGVRARAQFLTLALRPSATDPDRLDCLQVSGFVGLERLRPDVPWVIRRLRVHEDDGSGAAPFVREPLDPSGVVGASSDERPLSLLPAFSTLPLPSIRQRVGSNGWLYDELETGDVGRAGALDVIAGELYRSVLPLEKREDNVEGRYILTVRTPLERVQLDLLLDPSLTHFRWPLVTVLGNLEERTSSERAPGREVCPAEPAAALSMSGGATPLPRYSELVGWAFERAGWGAPSSFRGYRASMSYPPAPCEVVMTAELG